jgi:uncharacterized protein YyaL (SSP411 family)
METRRREESQTCRDPAPDLRTALTWRQWEDGRREAALHGIPILCCAEPPWTTAAQRLARNLAAMPSLDDAVERHAVPVWVDGIARPDLAARLSLSSVAAGHGDLPLLAFLTEQGEFLLGSEAMALDRNGAAAVEQPSLLGVLNTLGPRYRASRAEWITEAQATERRIWERAPLVPASLAREELDAAATKAGFLPIPLLQLLLDRYERDHAPALLAAVMRRLDALTRGGVCDQVDAGFHRGAREARWILPYFEKIIPQNAAMAALFARAAKLTGATRYSMVASRTAGFVCARLGEEDFTGAIAADSDFYTWTPAAFRSALDPEAAALLGRLYGMTGHESRHVLFQAPGEAELDAPLSATARAANQIERGRRALATYRARKPSPEPVRITAVDWIAATVESLAWARSAGLEEVDPAQLGRIMRRLLADSYDPDQGCAHGPDRRAFLFEDQARCLAALVALAELGGPAARSQAIELGVVLCRRYQDRTSGRFLAQCGGGEPSHAIVDGMLPAAVGDALAALGKLARWTGDTLFASTFEAAKAAYRPAASRLMDRAAHYWRAA